jgi:hypothetical protein
VGVVLKGRERGVEIWREGGRRKGRREREKGKGKEERGEVKEERGKRKRGVCDRGWKKE